jgi:hypothetical protein
MLPAMAMQAWWAASSLKPSARPAASTSEKDPEWSKPVGGLQCLLYLPHFDPKKTKAEDELLFELRNAGLEPIVLPPAMYDSNWLDRGIFAPVKDPLYGEIVVAQAQHKMTETPIRTKWECRRVGYDNEHIYLKYMSYGTSKLNQLKESGVI